MDTPEGKRAPSGAQAATEAPAAEARPRAPLVPMIISAVVMVVAAYAIVTFVLKPWLHGTPELHAQPSDTDPQAKGEIVRFEGIVVNPSGTLGSRYLSTTVGLEVTAEDAKRAVVDAEPMIKDALITHLSSRTIDELTDAASREAMREAIRALVNETIAPQSVRAVYFLDFVLQ